MSFDVILHFINAVFWYDFYINSILYELTPCREAIFLCHASGPLLRKNLMSLDYKADIEAEVVDAWASLCIHTFKEVGRVYRTCLRVASKVSRLCLIKVV